MPPPPAPISQPLDQQPIKAKEPMIKGEVITTTKQLDHSRPTHSGTLSMIPTMLPSSTVMSVTETPKPTTTEFPAPPAPVEHPQGISIIRKNHHFLAY